jgi:putative DNA primase/helicase
MNAQPINETEFAVRTFAEILASAKALQPDQLADVTAIVNECAPLMPIEQDAIFRAIKDATGIPLGTLKSQLSQQREAVPEPDHLDLARQVIESKGAGNILCAEAHVWGWQDSGVWAKLDDRAVKQDVQSALDTVAGIDVTSAIVNGVADVLKTEIFVQGHAFNIGNPEAVNCLNGQVELVGGHWQLMPHCRENYRTTQIPVAYDPKATARKFEAFLSQVFGGDQDGQDKRQALLELMGYTLMSHARHEKFVMLIGAGANGKSVLLTVLEALLAALIHRQWSEWLAGVA